MIKEDIINAAMEEIIYGKISGDFNKKFLYWILESMAADLQILWIEQQQESLQKALK